MKYFSLFIPSQAPNSVPPSARPARSALLAMFTLGLLSTESFAENLASCYRGNDLYRVGYYAQAVKEFSHCIEKGGLENENGAVAYLGRGNANRELGRMQEAMRDFDAALRLKPDYGEAYHVRGNANRQMGRSEAAIKDYSSALRLIPDNIRAYNNRGRTYAKLGQYDQAVADFRKKWQIAPETVRKDQKLFVRQGYYDGPLDGQVSEGTLKALNAWLRDGAQVD